MTRSTISPYNYIPDESFVIKPEQPLIIDPEQALVTSPIADAITTQISSPFLEEVKPSQGWEPIEDESIKEDSVITT